MRWIVLALALLASVCMIYAILPDWQHHRWQRAVLGWTLMMHAWGLKKMCNYPLPQWVWEVAVPLIIVSWLFAFIVLPMTLIDEKLGVMVFSLFGIGASLFSIRDKNV